MLIFTLTIFLGALLLFQVELIIGKTILPWFGGTSAVWITCMLFFQVLLLAGYAYGHALDRARTRAQTRLHQVLLLATVAVLAAQFVLWHSPLILDANWKPRAEGNPLLQILTLLTVSVGLPYLVLASTAPLLQSWWRRLYPQRSPYRLYAVSNFGSFLALFSYPFLVEPFLTLKTQALVWSTCFAAFAAGCAYCAARAARAPEQPASAEANPDRAAPRRDEDVAVAQVFRRDLRGEDPGLFRSAPSSVVQNPAPAIRVRAVLAARDKLAGDVGEGSACSGDVASAEIAPQTIRPDAGLIVLWLSLSACASALLLATTNQLCKNVAAVPLLWVLPLAIYLLTFTLCFESDRRYSRQWFHPAFALGTFLICFVLATGAGKDLLAQIAIYSFGLFAACMVCHGELVRLKPHPRHLTLFYLVIAAGGVLGGLFVALAAPYLFVGYWEYEVSLWLAALLFLVVLYRDSSSWLHSTRVPAPLVLVGAAALLPLSMALAVGSTQLAESIPSAVVIVAALFFLQRQSKQRKAVATKSAGLKPDATQSVLALGIETPGPAAAQANSTPNTATSATSESFPGDANLPIRGFRTETPQSNPPSDPVNRGKFTLLASCAIFLLVLGATLTTIAKATLGQIASVRNFYGALTIDHQFPAERDREAYALKHGEIFHGFEFRIAQKHMIPTSYFSEDSGLGLLLAPHRHAATPDGPGSRSASGSESANSVGAAPLRIGDVGLGIGTVAAYARAGDSVRFYEINPQVVTLASDPRYFQFLHDSAAPADVVLGDGRLSLEREFAQGAHNDYDVLIVDAFNGDAVPVHLLTIEAFELYVRRLKNPSGVLAMNVTNTFLDLKPVVIAAAEKLGLASLWVHCDGDGLVSYTNDWVLLSRNRQQLNTIAAAANDATNHPNTHAATLEASPSRLWTDDYSNLFEALKR